MMSIINHFLLKIGEYLMNQIIETDNIIKSVNGIKTLVPYEMVFLDESNLKEILSLQVQ